MENFNNSNHSNCKHCFFMGILGICLGLFFGVFILLIIINHSQLLVKPTSDLKQYKDTNGSSIVSKESEMSMEDKMLSLSNKRSATLLCPKYAKQSRSDEALLSLDFYLNNIVGYYNNLITMLFSIIAIILAVSFLYVYSSSRRRTEVEAREALKEESFRIILKDKIAVGVNNHFNDNFITDILREVELLFNYKGAEEINSQIDVLFERIEVLEEKKSSNIIIKSD